MKLLVVFVAFVAVCSGSPSPLVPGDNSNYVEGESRYIWMSNDHGDPILVDLQEPEEQNEIETRNDANNLYYLYTRQNANNPQLLTYGNANSIHNSNYGNDKALHVLIHGWNGNLNSRMYPQITSALLDVEDCNVIVVDWGAIAGGSYISAVAGVPRVGQRLGEFLQWLINTTEGHWNNVHIVGFSLGAHVAGQAGRAVSSQPSRITGLDPAGPLWHLNRNALKASDAQYVEIIHTDGGLQGILAAIGNADFYPNGGRNPQPGCSSSSCSHSLVYRIYAATVHYNHLIGKLCDDIRQAQANGCNGAAFNMGNSIKDKRGNGIFGLQTDSSWPY